MSARLTLLAGGPTVYVYGDPQLEEGLSELIATQRMILEVAYPGSDTAVGEVDADRWPAAREIMVAAGIEIVDTREEA